MLGDGVEENHTRAWVQIERKMLRRTAPRIVLTQSDWLEWLYRPVPISSCDDLQLGLYTFRGEFVHGHGNRNSDAPHEISERGTAPGMTQQKDEHDKGIVFRRVYISARDNEDFLQVWTFPDGVTYSISMYIYMAVYCSIKVYWAVGSDCNIMAVLIVLRLLWFVQFYCLWCSTAHIRYLWVKNGTFHFNKTN